MTAEPVRPPGGILMGLQADVEGGFLEAGLGNPARRVGSILLAPALPKPIGDVEPEGILRRQQGATALAHAPQHGIAELGEAMRTAIATHQFDGEVDHGVRGQLEAEKLRGGAQQDGPEVALLARQRPFDEGVQHVLQLALSAQNGGGHHAGQGPVTWVKERQIRLARHIHEHLLERALSRQHTGNEVHRQATRGQALRWPRLAYRFG